jgi:hypothetical protein
MQAVTSTTDLRYPHVEACNAGQYDSPRVCFILSVIAAPSQAGAGPIPAVLPTATLQHFNIVTSVSSAALPSPMSVQCSEHPFHYI